MMTSLWAIKKSVLMPLLLLSLGFLGCGKRSTDIEQQFLARLGAEWEPYFLTDNIIEREKLLRKIDQTISDLALEGSEHHKLVLHQKFILNATWAELYSSAGDSTQAMPYALIAFRILSEMNPNLSKSPAVQTDEAKFQFVLKQISAMNTFGAEVTKAGQSNPSQRGHNPSQRGQAENPSQRGQAEKR